MKVRFVAIAGGSGSGKTWLAHRLAEGLGKRAAVLSLDDFYHDRAHLTPTERRHINFDHPRSVDWRRYLEAVSRLRRGTAARVPVYDFTVSTRSATERRVVPAPIIVVDGLWPLHAPGSDGLYSLRVFVDAPADLRLARRMERDRKERGRTAASITREFRCHVEPMHLRFVEPQRAGSDIIVASPISTRTVGGLLRRMEDLLTPPP